MDSHKTSATGCAQLRKHPAFSAVAIITLALGIGANAAIFSVIHAVLVAALPYPHVDSLMQVWGPARSVKMRALLTGNFLETFGQREGSAPFSAM